MAQSPSSEPNPNPIDRASTAARHHGCYADAQSAVALVEPMIRGVLARAEMVVAGGMRTPFLLDRFPDIDPGVLQDPANVARAVLFVLTQPDETLIPELMVLPMRESSWP